MNMCLDRMQNCVIEQRSDQVNTITKCDLLVDKAQEIDKLWKNYNSAIFNLKWWGRISNLILYTNIILVYTCPPYAGIAVGA